MNIIWVHCFIWSLVDIFLVLQDIFYKLSLSVISWTFTIRWSFWCNGFCIVFFLFIFLWFSFFFLGVSLPLLVFTYFCIFTSTFSLPDWTNEDTFLWGWSISVLLTRFCFTRIVMALRWKYVFTAQTNHSVPLDKL